MSMKRDLKRFFMGAVALLLIALITTSTAQLVDASEADEIGSEFEVELKDDSSPPDLGSARRATLSAVINPAPKLSQAAEVIAASACAAHVPKKISAVVRRERAPPA